MLYQVVGAPINVQIELTTKCSNNCPHCYNYHRHDDEVDTTMSTVELRKTFDALDAAKVFSVALTGGEPLLQPDLIIEGINLCSNKGITCIVNTNLTVATEELIAEMKKVGAFTITTSIASFQESMHDAMMGRTGSFQKTLRGIELLKKHDIKFSVNMVVTQTNASQVYETGIFAHELGAKSFSATKASPPLGCNDYSTIQPTKDQVIDSLDSLLRVQKDTGMHVDILECYPLCFIKDMGKYEKFTRRKCTAGIYSATIGSDGQVRPCSHSNRVYGSILTEDMVTIFARMSEWKTGELLPRKCLKCTFLKKCSGGCRCEAEYAGNIKNLDPYASDPSSIIPFLEINQIEIDIDPMTKILVKLDLKFRKEDFGYLIWKNNNVTMVDEEAGILLKKMQQTEMTLVDAATISCSKLEDVTAMIKDLITQNFIRLDQTT